jgi:hypothetical protein
MAILYLKYKAKQSYFKFVNVGPEAEAYFNYSLKSGVYDRDEGEVGDDCGV